MKLALVVPGGVDRSGQVRVIPALLDLIRRLARAHNVHVFALNQEPRPGRWTLEGASIHNIGPGFTRARALRALAAEHLRGRFALVHSIWSGAPGLVAVAAARMLRVPSIVHVTGGELLALPDIAYGGRLSWRGRLREGVVLRAATAVTATSAPMLASLAALGIAARRIAFGVDLERWPACEPCAREPGAPARLIHIGSLNRVKDQPVLLRALAELSREGVAYEMDIVGEDTLRGETQRLSEALGLQGRVRFHGFLTQPALRPLIERAHLMVMSSRHEAGPFVLLEAALAGVPTVGSAVGHIAEWAPTAAVAVPVGNWTALARSVSAVLADESVRLHLAREAQRRALSGDADYTARAVQALYDELLAA